MERARKRIKIQTGETTKKKTKNTANIPIVNRTRKKKQLRKLRTTKGEGGTTTENWNIPIREKHSSSSWKMD